MEMRIKHYGHIILKISFFLAAKMKTTRAKAKMLSDAGKKMFPYKQ
jgi:hypothetical protein